MLLGFLFLCNGPFSRHVLCCGREYKSGIFSWMNRNLGARTFRMNNGLVIYNNIHFSRKLASCHMVFHLSFDSFHFFFWSGPIYNFIKKCGSCWYLYECILLWNGLGGYRIVLKTLTCYLLAIMFHSWTSSGPKLVDSEKCYKIDLFKIAHDFVFKSGLLLRQHSQYRLK